MFAPSVYAKLKLGHDRGEWISKELDIVDPKTGCLNGRVTTWQLQTLMHRDRKDVLCAIFCSGHFEGGEAIFPDLGMKFAFVSCATSCIDLS